VSKFSAASEYVIEKTSKITFDKMIHSFIHFYSGKQQAHTFVHLNKKHHKNITLNKTRTVSDLTE